MLQSTDYDISACAPAESVWLESKDSFYDNLHTVISSIPAHNFLIVLEDFNACIRNIFHDPSHKLLADTHITKTPTITANNLLTCMVTASLYLFSILNHIKRTTRRHENTLMAFTEHRLTLFYWEENGGT